MIEDAPKEEICSNTSEFQMRISEAQINGEEFIIVSDELFRKLTKAAKTPYITWGDPGIKVYPPGKREACEKADARRVE